MKRNSSNSIVDYWRVSGETRQILAGMGFSLAPKHKQHQSLIQPQNHLGG
jgi:hypothetical protein